jgi:hypothetical protein
VSDREAAVVLRAIELGARDMWKAAGPAETAYLSLVARLLQVNKALKPRAAEPAKTGSIIIP